MEMQDTDIVLSSIVRFWSVNSIPIWDAVTLSTQKSPYLQVCTIRIRF